MSNLKSYWKQTNKAYTTLDKSNNNGELKSAKCGKDMKVNKKIQNYTSKKNLFAVYSNRSGTTYSMDKNKNKC